MTTSLIIYSIVSYFFMMGFLLAWESRSIDDFERFFMFLFAPLSLIVVAGGMIAEIKNKYFPLIILFLAFNFSLFAQSHVTATGRAYVSDNTTPSMAYKQALQNARVNALHQAGIPVTVVSEQSGSENQNIQYPLTTNDLRLTTAFTDNTQTAINGEILHDSIISDSMYIDAQRRIVCIVVINAIVDDNSRHCEAQSNLTSNTIHSSLFSLHSGITRGDCENGYGTCNYYNGDTYTGYWKDGKRNGYGVYRWADGGIYKGYWNNGDGNYLCKSIRNYESGIRNPALATSHSPLPTKLDNDAANFAREAEAEKQKLQ